MKRINDVVAWALFLLLAGIFLLLKNLGVLGKWGEVVWGGLFVALGLAFAVWFILDRQRWWRAIAGFTLLSIGTVILLSWRNGSLGDWGSAVVLFGVAIGFLAVLSAHADNWWAVIPGGALAVVGLLVGLRGSLSQSLWLALLCIGLGLVFLLLYLVRFGQHDTRWAAIPAAAFLLVGSATLVGTLGVGAVLLRWWPALLVLAGVALLLIYWLSRRPIGALPPTPAEEPVAAEVPSAPALPFGVPPSPAPELPEASQPVPEVAPPVLPEAEGEERPAVDIYDILAQQPPQAPEEDETARPS